jgi:toxin YoeB
MIVSFRPKALEDMLWLATHEPKLARKAWHLIAECIRTPFTGTGKPEPLKHDLAGWWSRRITDEHRLVYRVVEDRLEIAQCRYHY